MNFAQLLKKHRLKSGLTQEELAEKSGLGRSTIGNLETGDRAPPLDCLTQICGALGIEGEDKTEFTESAHLAHSTDEIRSLVARLRNRLIQLTEHRIENEAKLALVIKRAKARGIDLSEFSADS